MDDLVTDFSLTDHRAVALIHAFGIGDLVRSGFVDRGTNGSYRDLRFIVPFVVQFGLYILPMAFSTNVVSARSGCCFTH
jgi:ABC-type polysaccharide/polyol phosphate export permease